MKTKPELYNVKLLQYNDSTLKTHSWHEIGVYLKHDGLHCHKRWKYLRQKYRKRINEQTTKSKPNETNDKWKLECQLDFLKDFINEEDRLSIISENTNEEDLLYDDVKCIKDTNCSKNDIEPEKRGFVESNDSPTESMMCKHQRTMPTKNSLKSCSSQDKAKFITQNESEKTTHPIDTFFSLMAQSVKTFSLSDQHFVKTNIFSLVSDIEGRYILQNQQLSAYQYSS